MKQVQKCFKKLQTKKNKWFKKLQTKKKKKNHLKTGYDDEKKSLDRAKKKLSSIRKDSKTQRLKDSKTQRLKDSVVDKIFITC